MATLRGEVREARPWLVRFGRLGFVAKGIVYVLVGLLAVLTAIGAGGEATGSKGALARIGEAPFGRILLIGMGIGIVGYASWRLLQAFLDTENKGTGGKGIAVRSGYFLIGVLHIGLATSAFRLVMGNDDGGGSGESTRGWTAELMSQPYGQWLVAIAGGAVMAYSGYQFYRAYSLKFRKKLELQKMSATEDRWATQLGRVGYGARGVVLAVVGTFLIVAAVHAEPQEARGLDEALATLAEQQWGSIVLGIVALGLIAYGIFMFVQARYRRMVIT